MRGKAFLAAFAIACCVAFAGRVMPQDKPDQGWFGETLPASMHRGDEKPVYVFDTGKGVLVEMVYVPPGDFTMGADDADAGMDEKPQHVHPMPDGYYLGRHETTWKQYLAFCKAAGHAQPDRPKWVKGDDEPVVNVSWEDAKAFCDWAGLRLPTEAEWEKGARGTDGRKYPWGNDWDGSLCNHGGANPFKGDDSDGFQHTAPVGSYPKGASPYGALDMIGNAWEFCADWFEVDAYSRYAKGDLSPAKGEHRVVRGGGWNFPETCRVTLRDNAPPFLATEGLGFRCAR